MARGRRNERVVLNFDGLTDAVTNLTGTLILLVVLIFGITTEARTPSPPPPPSPPAEKTHQGKPIRPLLQKIEILRLQIEQTDQQIRMLGDDLPRLEAQVQELQQKADALRLRSGSDKKNLQAHRTQRGDNRST